MITRPQAAALADLLRVDRPGWDALATIDALLEVGQRRTLGEVAWAAIAAAADPNNRSPKAITFDGPHWASIPSTSTRDLDAERAERQDRAAEAKACRMCDDNGRQTNGWLCPHDGLTPDQRAEQVASRAAAARAAVRPLRADRVLEPEGSNP